MEPTTGQEEFLRIAIQRLQVITSSSYRDLLPTQSQVPADSPLRPFLPSDSEREANQAESSSVTTEGRENMEQKLVKSMIFLSMISNEQEYKVGLSSLEPFYGIENTPQDMIREPDVHDLFSVLDTSKCTGYCNKKHTTSLTVALLATTTQLASVALSGCQGCKLILQCAQTILGYDFEVDLCSSSNEAQIDEESDGEVEPILISGKFYFKKGGVKKAVKDFENLIGLLPKSIQIRFEPTILFYTAAKDQKKPDVVEVDEVWELFSTQDSFPGFWNVKQHGLISGNTKSDKALCLIKEWLNSCLSTHRNCTKAMEDFTRPRRLLEVSPQGLESKIILRDSGGISSDAFCSYVCLSHRWGSEGMPIKTTKSTIDGYMIGINMDELPQTFKDAVLMTRKLGIKYLWIDSLCIIQDDAEDWNSEASKMASVYSNAYVTLAAASSTDAHGGLFFEFLDSPRSVGLTGDGFIDNLELFVRPTLPHFTWTHVGGGNPSAFSLLTRGWVFQERLLSRRIIYFTERELMWECMEKSHCECGSFHQESKIGEHEEIIDKANFHRSWHRIIEAYSSLKLTYQVDKLPALSGIAQMFRENYPNSIYVAGFWSEVLPDGLQWSIDETEELKARSEQHAPTWSWASVPNRIVFRDETRKEKEKDWPYKLCGSLIRPEPINVEHTLMTGNIYGHFARCDLQIRTTIGTGVLLKNKLVTSIKNELQPFQVSLDNEKPITFHADYDITQDPLFHFHDLDDTMQICDKHLTVVPLGVFMYRHGMYNPMFSTFPVEYHKRFVYLVLDQVVDAPKKPSRIAYRRLGLAWSSFSPLINLFHDPGGQKVLIELESRGFTENDIFDGCSALKSPLLDIILI